MLLNLYAMLIIGGPSASRSLATDPAPTKFTFDATLSSVAIFRDGFGYFSRTGSAKLEDGWATTTTIPHAISGTLWIYSLDKSDVVDQVITTKENRISFKDIPSLKAKLSDKIGLSVSVKTRFGQELNGPIHQLLPDMLLIQQGAAYTAIPYDQITEVVLDGYPLRIHISTSNPNKVAKIGISYLQDGINWQPSYILNLEGTKGTLTLRAAMKNSIEDINHSDVSFVVGSPFLSERGVTDLISLAPPPSLQEIAKSSNGTFQVRGKAGNMIGGSDENHSGSPNAEAQDNMVVDPTHPMNQPMGSLSGSEAGELFYYKKSGLDLLLGDTAMVTVFTQQIDVHPQFTWNADGDEVNFQLHFKNTSPYPYTTGSVFVIDDGRPLGQNTIDYTPLKGTAKLKLSQGIGLRVQRSEEEVKRGGAVQMGKVTFFPVTLKGTLTIENHRKGEANVDITKTLIGKINNLSDGGIVTDSKVLNGEVDTLNHVKWTVNLTPGESKVLTYSYTTMVTAGGNQSPPIPISQD